MSSLGAFSMWDLFRGEVESQMQVLTKGLLAIESGAPPQEHLAATMRAAHSIKGAAKIVQLDLGVRLAHSMEDCLVAAQEGQIALNSRSVDVLLSAGDLLAHLSAVSEESVPQWIEEQGATVENLVAQLEKVRAGSLNGDSSDVKPAASVLQEQVSSPESGNADAELAAIVMQVPTAEPTPAKSSESQAAVIVESTEVQDRMLKVRASTLNRLVGLAGESLIHSRRIEEYAEALSKLKRRQVEVSEVLDLLEAQLENSGETPELLNSARNKLEDVRNVTAAHQMELETFAMQSARLSDRLYREALATRMRPFGDGVQGYPRMVRDLARTLGKQVQLEIEGSQTEVDREILERLEAPLNHTVRNSVDHGIESPDKRIAAGKPASGTIRIEARHRAGLFVLTVSDDGRGIDMHRLRSKIVERGLATSEMAANFSDAELTEFLFLPGFSTASSVTEISGRGVGLDVVKDMAKSVGGTARLTSELGKGVSLTFELPLTLSVVRTLVAEIGGEPFAIPLTRIAKTAVVPVADFIFLEGQQYFSIDGERVGVVPAHEVLGLDGKSDRKSEVPILLLGDRAERYGLVVDRFIGEHDMVVRPLDSRLGKIQDVSACALMEDGTAVLILDVEDLIHSLQSQLQNGQLRGVTSAKVASVKRRRILVVDDSITVREVERSLLKSRGYDVEVAVDGMDGWNALKSQPFDLLLTDVDMPRMTGIELVSRVRSDPTLRSIPVIIVSYKDRDEDRMRGLEAGADRYMTKSSFHDATLVTAVLELIGPPE